MQPGDDERGGLAIDVLRRRARPRTPHGRTTSPSVRPASMCGPGSSMRSSPAGPSTPVRNSTDDRCPSPTARRLRMNRQLPGRRPDWSGCSDGGRVEQGGRLDRELVGEPGAHEAAALVATDRRRRVSGARSARSSPSARPAGHGGAPRSGHRPASRSTPTSSSGSARIRRQHPGGPGPTVVRELVTGHEQPRQHPRRVRGQVDVGPRDALASPDVLRSTRRAAGGPAAASRAAPKWTPRPGSRCARCAPDRRSRLRSPGRASECRSRCRRGTTPRRARLPSAHRRRPSIRYARRAGVGQRRHLDRLLVECRVRPRPDPSPRPGRRTDARRGVCRSSSQSSRPRPSATSDGRIQRGARGEQGLGQRRVGVAQPRLRPRPRLVERRPADRDAPPSISARASTWSGTRGEHLRRAERGERHRARVRRAQAGATRRTRRSARSRRCGTRATAVPRPHSARPQQSSTDAVSDQRQIGPPPVVEPAVGLLRRQHERQVLLAEVVQLADRPARGRRPPAPAPRRRGSSRAPAAGWRPPRARTTRPRR